MAVVRLELAVPDDIASQVAEDLHAQHVRVSALPEGWLGAHVRVISDEEARKERAIMEFVRCFFM